MHKILAGILASGLVFRPGTRKRMSKVQTFCRRIPRMVYSPFVVKVGSHDGLKGDPCGAEILLRKKWRGLLIEPVPYLLERAMRNFNDAARFSFASCAVGAVRGLRSFYFLPPSARQELEDLPSWFDQLGSFSRDHIVARLGERVRHLIEEISVPIKPLTQVLREKGISRVHLLQIDTEGADLEVLRSLQFDDTFPLAIFIEHKHLCADDKAVLLALLQDKGYSVHDEGCDYFALDEKAFTELRRRSFFGLFPVKDA